MLVESSRGTWIRQYLLEMGLKKELFAGMTDDDLEVLLDGFRTLLAIGEKASSEFGRPPLTRLCSKMRRYLRPAGKRLNLPTSGN